MNLLCWQENIKHMFTNLCYPNTLGPQDYIVTQTHLGFSLSIVNPSGLNPYSQIKLYKPQLKALIIALDSNQDSASKTASLIYTQHNIVIMCSRKYPPSGGLKLSVLWWRVFYTKQQQKPKSYSIILYVSLYSLFCVSSDHAYVSKYFC